MRHQFPRGYWKIKENVINDAKKYKTSKDWKINSPTAYRTAYSNNWVDECPNFFVAHRKVEVGHWGNKKNVIKDARHYKTRSEWRDKSGGAYQAAVKWGWLEETCKHMVIIRGKWQIKKNVIKDSKKYNSRSEWNKNSNAAYQAARLKGWLEKCCRHMAIKWGKWQIIMNVVNDSKKYETRHDWIVNSNSAYQAASRNGWLGECHAPKGAVLSRTRSFK